MQPRALVMRPQNRDLFDAQSRAPGQKQNFGIECPALNFLQGKNARCGIAAKGLESTLRVREMQAEHDAQHKIENSPENLTMERLALGLTDLDEFHRVVTWL